MSDFLIPIFLQTYIIDLRYLKLLKNLSFKYQRLAPSSCKYIVNRKFQFVAKTQFLLTLFSYYILG